MPLTEDFTYKLGDDGIVLNPDSSIFPFVDVKKINGLDSAPYRTTERQHEGTDGSFMDAEFEKGRTIVIDGTLYADGYDVESILDALKYNYAPSRTLMPFYFKKPGVSERFMRVKPLGCRYDVETLRRLGITDIQFTLFAEDPRIYSSILHDEVIMQETNVLTGRSYNKEYNYGYGAAIDPAGANIVVGGNRPTPVLMTIYGPAQYPRIINETLGTSMSFELTMGDGDALIIDTQYHTVRLNGANRRSALTNPTWFSLLPGNNYIRYRTAGTVTGSFMTVQFYDAWR